VTLPGRTRQSGKCEHGGAEAQQGAGREQALAGAVRSVVHPDRQYETQPQAQFDVPLEGVGLRRRYSWAELFKRVFLEDVPPGDLAAESAGDAAPLLQALIELRSYLLTSG